MKPLWLHFHMVLFVFRHFKTEIWIFFFQFWLRLLHLSGERVKRMLFHLSMVGLVSAPLLYWDLFTHHYTSVCVCVCVCVFFSSLLGYFDVVIIKFRPWWAESLQWLEHRNENSEVMNLILTWSSEFFWAFWFRILFLPNFILMKQDKRTRSSPLHLFQRDLGVPIAQLSKKKRGNKLR